MITPVFEPFTAPVFYALHSSLIAQATKVLRDARALNTNLPYGTDSDIFPAGLIAVLSADGGVTAIKIAGTSAVVSYNSVILCGSFVDALDNGKADCYPLGLNGVYRVKSNYIKTQAYPVGTVLTYVPSGDEQGKLVPTSAYGSQPKVAIVIEAPASPSNDDEMVIQTIQPIIA